MFPKDKLENASLPREAMRGDKKIAIPKENFCEGNCRTCSDYERCSAAIGATFLCYDVCSGCVHRGNCNRTNISEEF